MRDRWSWVYGPVLAGAGALTMRLAFPQPGWWVLLVPGLAAVLAATRLRRGWRSTVLAGAVSGLAFYGPLIHWATLFLGWLPWLALTAVMAAGWTFGFWLIALAHRWIGRSAWAPVVSPVIAAGLWTTRDLIASNWPYGGFAWGRLAQSQSAGPFLDLTSWLGIPGTGFVLAVLAGWLASGVIALARPTRHPLLRGLPPAAAILAATIVAALPGYRVPTSGTITVAGIQGGDEKAGYFMGGQAGDVLAAHERATALLDPDSRPDVIVWPEVAAEWDPRAYPQLATRIDALHRRYGAPLLIGAVTGDGALLHNSQLWWPEVSGDGGQYDKRNPVPFGEYVPDRAFYERIVPDLIGLIGREYAPGIDTPVLPMETRDGRSAPVGVAICFDIIDDRLARQAVVGGAQWLVSPTNNADFGRTDELDQQLAFARLRAVETGRSMVQVSTVGHTAAYGPDGSLLAQVPWYTPEAMVVRVPLSTTLTPAVRWGRAISLAAAGIGVAGLLGSGLMSTRRRGRDGLLWSREERIG